MNCQLGNKTWLIASILLFGVGCIFQILYKLPFTFDAIFFSRSYKYYMFGFVAFTIFIINIIFPNSNQTAEKKP